MLARHLPAYASAFRDRSSSGRDINADSVFGGTKRAGTGRGRLGVPIVLRRPQDKHVVYVVQENRSFDDIFQGYPHADTVLRGKDSYGKTIKLRPISLKTAYEIDHSAQGMFAACNGTGPLPGTDCRMDGFNREGQYGGPRRGQYAYVPHHESKPYFDMAHEWVLADQMFASQLDESFVAHQYIIAAQAGSSVDVPDFYWGCPGGPNDTVSTITHRRTYGQGQRPCFDYQTLGDEFSHAGFDWRFYTSRYPVPFSGLWSGYQAVKHVFYSRVWKTNVITPQKKFEPTFARASSRTSRG